MDKKALITLFDSILKPIGFKRKNNYWILDSKDFSKVINLQKSNWSHLYYINYGYNFKDLQIDDLAMHIYNRINSMDENGDNILNFDNNILDRIKKIELLILGTIKILNKYHSKNDLILDLKERPHLNEITLKVKEYLEL